MAVEGWQCGPCQMAKIGMLKRWHEVPLYDRRLWGGRGSAANTAPSAGVGVAVARTARLEYSLTLSPYETTAAGCQNRAQWAASFMCVHPRP